ncbi:MAG: glycosyltransferase [Pseudomonadota bacterium]
MSISLFISASLYPSSAQPQRGLFVEKRLNALADYLGEKARFHVISPTPYFPLTWDIFGRYALYAKTPKTDQRGAFDIDYTRFMQLPLIGHHYVVDILAARLDLKLQNLRDKQQKPDLLVAEYCFPDLLALAKLGRKYHIPVIGTARGSDISYFPNIPTVRKQFTDYIPNISAISAMSSDLREDVIQLGFAPEKVHVIGNGVDTTLFSLIENKDQIVSLRAKYGLFDKKIILSVGGLIPRKGHDLAIRALIDVPQATLVIVGTGPEEKNLKHLAETSGIRDRVLFLGSRTQAELAELYSITDLFLLCSLSEGRANVLMEAAAGGAPLISADVQGTKDVITSADIGTIFSHRDPKRLAMTLNESLIKTYNRDYIRQSVLPHSWEACAKNYANLILQFTGDKGL